MFEEYMRAGLPFCSRNGGRTHCAYGTARHSDRKLPHGPRARAATRILLHAPHRRNHLRNTHGVTEVDIPRGDIRVFRTLRYFSF